MISSTSGTFTPEGYAEALSRFGDSIRPSIKKALQKNAGAVRAIYMAKARKHGIIKAIFGANAKGMGGSVKTKVTDKGNVFILSLELRGLAAMQEEGGRTKPHVIRPRSGKALKLSGMSSLGSGFAASVLHPGSNIRRFPVAQSAITTMAPRIAAAIDKAICEFSAGGVRIATAAA